MAGAGVGWRMAVALAAVVLTAACSTAGVPAPAGSGAGPVVVTFGDSVPAGAACGCTPFPDLYAQLLAPGATSTNLAESGYTSADVRDQLTTSQAKAAVRAADVVLLMVGANDVAAAFDADASSYTESAGQVRDNVTAVVTAVRALRPAAPVLVLGYWNVVEDGDVARRKYDDDGLADAAAATTACNTALRAAADAGGGRYVDTVAAFRGESTEEDPTGLLSADGDHPNAAGHEAIAQASYAALPHPTG